MRLTLRTLLAWMDDTLPPAEVKDIGNQVSGSPFAQQLIERIRKATRRRKLTIPPASGDGATDPNLVAAYLDNELDGESVGEYEKLCLKSEVHLAEAASCHQILSMIKNKAKVPAESRYRMYRLVRGRESTRPTERGKAQAPAAMNGGPSVPPWSGATVPRSSAWERFGLPALAASLMGVLLWIGFSNLRAPEPPPAPGPLVDNQRPDEDPDAAFVGVPDEPPANAPVAGAEPGRRAGNEAAEEAEPAVAEKDAEPNAPTDDAPAPAAAAPGASGVVAAADGLLFRRGSADGAWTRLDKDEALEAGDRLVHLAPLAATIRLGEVPMTLVGPTEVVVGTPEEGQAARFDLIRGQVSLPSPKDAAIGKLPVGVGFEGKLVSIERPTRGAVGLIARGVRPTGQSAGRKVLIIHVDEGRAVVSVDPAAPSEPIQGPAARMFDPIAGLSPAQSAPAPPWVADPTPSPVDRQNGANLASLFGDGSVTFSLLEGVEDSRPAVQQLSVAALASIGDDEQVVALLGRPKAPVLRKSALTAIQGWLAERPDALEKLRPLLRDYAETPEAAAELERLSIGLTEQDLAKKATYEELVRDLSSPNPSVRELAISALMGLTGRDALGYDPDDFEAGAKAWRQLLETGQLGPPAPPPAARPGT